MHFLGDIIVGSGAVARGRIAIFLDGLQDLLGKTDGLDAMLPRDGLSVRGNAHTIVNVSVEHTVDVKNHVSKVLRALTVVGYEELVCSLVVGYEELVCSLATWRRGGHHSDIILASLAGP
jgi:hypothetical protein